MTAGAAPVQGETIGPYRIEGVIGAGAMGTVYVARDLRLDRRVALKVMLAAEAGSEAFVARFHRETAVLARLDSPHVVAIFDHGEHRGLPYLVTQYAAGGDLGRLLARRGPMPPALAARVCAQVADGLVAAHEVGIVHRDVKPANVLLRDDAAERLHVYLADFGVALTETSALTSAGAVAGTWNYLAPERVHGYPGSPATDIYSVGCLLVELLTGRPPYVGTDVAVALEHVTSPVPQLPGQDDTTVRLNRVLQHSLAKLPEHRYPTAAALRDDLRALADGLTGGFAPTVVAPGRSPSRRGRLLVGAAVVTAALVGSGVAVALEAMGDRDTGTAGPAGTTSTEGSSTDGTSTMGGGDPDGEPSSQPIYGDVDGDGLGDLVYATFDSAFVRPSTGREFAEPEKQRGPGGTVVRGDFLGSGGDDLLRIDDSTGSVGLTIIAPGRRTSSAINTPANRTDLDLDFAAADVDGDGRSDLVVSTPTRDGTTLSVALSAGDGTFSPARTWFAGDLVADDAGLAVGDFDGDGDDDLVHYSATGEYGDTADLVMLASTGSSFEVDGDVAEVPEQIGDAYYSLDVIQAGDVDGDGTPELVAYNPYGMDALVFEWEGTSFVQQDLWTEEEPPEAGGGGIYGVLGDVDGDGLTDIVTSGTDGLRVHLSTGDGFDYAPGWRVRGDFPSSDLVGPVALGIY